MTFDRATASIGSGVPGRYVILSQTCGIEPILERCNRAIVFERPSVPHAFKRRYLVIPGCFSSLQSIARICADALDRECRNGCDDPPEA